MVAVCNPAVRRLKQEIRSSRPACLKNKNQSNNNKKINHLLVSGPSCVAVAALGLDAQVPLREEIVASSLCKTHRKLE